MWPRYWLLEVALASLCPLTPLRPPLSLRGSPAQGLQTQALSWIHPGSASSWLGGPRQVASPPWPQLPPVFSGDNTGAHLEAQSAVDRVLRTGPRGPSTPGASRPHDLLPLPLLSVSHLPSSGFASCLSLSCAASHSCLASLSHLCSCPAQEHPLRPCACQAPCRVTPGTQMSQNQALLLRSSLSCWQGGDSVTDCQKRGDLCYNGGRIGHP